ncbi:hypothetical protein K402DRAFT_211244 [Aulographum hederae CBS 113979]|uniref:Heterokaryon incompatibility domain-containing protein n=1 Tax=Aulographum hederae CBS 113979 TaxID=1176131 RepID=A0A6G1GMX3_9PEZI|nr:hypothetical protein K402DRAFT_211244 [Aulographum hederae CBS 113979]
MLDLGWCPHQIDYLAKSYDVEDLSKFASFDGRDHRAANHLPCLDTTQCVAFNTDMNNYPIKHAATCSGIDCYVVRVPYDKLIRVIKSGDVPLISIKDDPKDGLSLRIHRRRFGDIYASTNHAWADGFGNPLENALPSCQVKQLQALHDHAKPQDDKGYLWLNKLWSPLNKLSRDRRPSSAKVTQPLSLFEKTQHSIRRLGNVRLHKMFWMDTLCIPVQKKDKELKRRCIDAMASIYALSHTVFVLDRELMALSNILQDEREAKYRIACSAWMCRSWTLQEGMLPRYCLFLFSDGVFDALSSSEPGQSSEKTRLRSQPAQIEDCGSISAVSALPDENIIAKRSIAKRSSHLILPIVRPRNTPNINRFISIWNDFAGRSTTMPEDLYVVFASCLDFKLRQLQAFKRSEDKMQRIVLSHQELPFSLFFNTGERFDSSGNHYNRWLPTEISRDRLV